MKTPPIPADDTARLRALHQLGLLDSQPSESFDRITRLAARALDVPILLVSLVDESRQWFKSCVGLNASETSRDVSFCGHVVYERQAIIVPDARLDPRFADNPLVVQPPHIRAYLGVPLFTLDQHPVGTLCAIDTRPRDFGADDAAAMQDFAKLVEELIHTRELQTQTGAVLRFASDQERFFQDTFEQAAVGMSQCSPSGHLTRVNQRLCSMLGYRSEELHGRRLVDLTHPDDADKLRGLDADMQAGAIESYRIDQRLKTRGEAFLWVSLSAALKTDDAGRADYSILVIEDIADKKAMEFALSTQARISAERLRRIADGVPAMIGYWNRDLRCEFANESYRDYFGLSPSQMLGMTLREVLGETLYALNEPYMRLALEGKAQRFERIIEKGHGVRIFTDARYTPDVAADGVVRGFYVLVNDITRLQEASAKLEAANEQLRYTNGELDQFVYTASHDLRSPLRAVESLAKFVLEDDPSLTVQTRERIELMCSRAQRMQNLLDQLLEFARAGTRNHQGGPPIPADRLIDEIAATLAPGPSFTVVKHASLSFVDVHPVPLAQVFHNLIGNAVKHHDRGHGTIEISVQRQGNALRFCVADDGPGIPESQRERVFNMFTTLRSKDEVEGSGMGLSLVRRLVTLHGGQCGIAPTSGRGTVLWFDWPVRHIIEEGAIEQNHDSAG